MADLIKPKPFALDTNILFDLADEQDFALTFLEVFLQKGYSFSVPPTAIQELFSLSDQGEALATRALSEMLNWQIRPFDLIPVGHGITEAFSFRLRNSGLLPYDENNDGLILAETSLAEIGVLVTSDNHLLNIDDASLRLAFDASDLPFVHPAHPKNLLRAIR